MPPLVVPCRGVAGEEVPRDQASAIFVDGGADVEAVVKELLIVVATMPSTISWMTGIAGLPPRMLDDVLVSFGDRRAGWPMGATALGDDRLDVDCA